MSVTVTATPDTAVAPTEAPGVSVVFTFGYGHVDPNSGEALDDPCAIVTAPNVERCRALMVQHFGRQWAFEYDSLLEATVPGSQMRIHVVIEETQTVVWPAGKFFRRPSESPWINAETGKPNRS